MRSYPSPLLVGSIIVCAAVMSFVGLRILEIYADERSIAHPVHIAVISIVLWLIAFPFVARGRVIWAVLFGALSPFVGALMFMPHPHSLVVMARWSPVSVPVGICTGLFMWLLRKLLAGRSDSSATA